MFDYDDARETAKELIEDFGGAGQVILKGVTGGFDNNGDVIADTPDTIIDGIITPLVQYKTHEIDGSSIKNGDAWVFFHTDTNIEIDMQVTLNSKTFRIINVVRLSSVDDINIYQKLQLRIG